MRKHLSGTDLPVVIVTKDAKGLTEALLADTPSTIKYDAEKPKALLDEDKVIGALEARHAAGGRHDHAGGRRVRTMTHSGLPLALARRRGPRIEQAPLLSRSLRRPRPLPLLPMPWL